MLMCNYIIVFNNDGLDLDGVKKDIESLGIRIDRVMVHRDDETDVTMLFLNSSLVKHSLLKARYNCLEKDWILWPMAPGEKERALAMMKES